MKMKINPGAEWIETDGLGGFASGTVSGVRTRRYHALLLSSAAPPTDRFVLVNGLDAWLETPDGSFPISTQRYAPGVTHPEDAALLESFEPEPFPRWTFTSGYGMRLEHELFVRHGNPVTCLRWRLLGGGKRATLCVRPLFSGRDLHALHHENPSFAFEPLTDAGRLLWHPYPDVPGIAVHSNGAYEHHPDWYRSFQYEEEHSRGLDFLEDLAAPGVFRFDLDREDAVLILSAEGLKESPAPARRKAPAAFNTHRAAEMKRREAFPSRLAKSADAYLVQRGRGKTIIAGYPWFTDWGRDTFISLRGLCLATGRLREARDILLEWSGAVSEGMLPNRFPDRGEVPEYNSVDASLWYVVAVHDFLQASKGKRPVLAAADRRRLQEAVEQILEGYSHGTRFGIRMDEDGLLRCGEPGVQLTWMDAKVGDWVVTPRIGKPVEIQALWLNALAIGSGFSKRWEDAARRGRLAFEERFWNDAGGFLYDVVDVDHLKGAVDATFRPNQIYAVGDLPLSLLDGTKAGRVVSAVEQRLLTPIGLRSLSPGEPGYAPRYEGGVRERDGAYHQGTVWPYLLGPFVEAWVRVHGNGKPASAILEARKRFLDPLLGCLDAAGIGHLPEIADAESPHTPRGCPFQAWSVAEALRLVEQVLAPGKRKPAVRSRRRQPHASTSPG
ncbi:MAG: amylo-alpha-1,6-glucosidase [Acidobacteria bacterium]|nr:amylo-alpha-1,6-glucosidase [Acidobacteriota bacterium]